MEDMEYRNFFSNFVDDEYLELADDEALEYAWSYSETGGSPKTCVALGLSETENLGWSLDEIADEVGVSRKALYNARDELGLVE